MLRRGGREKRVAGRIRQLPFVQLVELKTYDWLHLHHEDFTGQYSKFFLNYNGAPWLQEMVERNEPPMDQRGDCK